MGDWVVRDRVGSGYPADSSRAAMESGFVLTGATFDERLKSTRISGRLARPLSEREAVSKLMEVGTAKHGHVMY